MPKGTKVHKCVERLRAQGKTMSEAVAICQAETGQSYSTGKPIKKKAKKK